MHPKGVIRGRLLHRGRKRMKAIEALYMKRRTCTQRRRKTIVEVVEEIEL
jgi:hypothetical protein